MFALIVVMRKCHDHEAGGIMDREHCFDVGRTMPITRPSASVMLIVTGNRNHM